MASETRIVSLVPSITELLCDLGLADHIVGRTGFCIHPWNVVRGIPKVGGTKDVNLEKIAALGPTHAIVNVDENRREDAEALRQFVPNVVVTHPCAPRDNLDLYTAIGSCFGREGEAAGLCDAFEHVYAQALAQPRSRRRVLYLIWRDPWMSVGPDTYISRTLALFDWHTVPRSSTSRYPLVDLPSTAEGADHILLSSEPYHFKERDVAELRDLLPHTEISLIDGEMTSWYGSRAINGLQYLSGYTSRYPERAHSEHG